MSWFIGIDVGSVCTKAVITNGGEIVACQTSLSGADYKRTADKVLQKIIDEADLRHQQVTAIVATGVGAGNVRLAHHCTSDIVCTARGTHSLLPLARMAIDVGGQSVRVIRVDSGGQVTNFAVSEKCAAGSGQFVEAVANVLRIELADFGPLSLTSANPVVFGTGCAVFGETEAITMVCEGVPREDVAAGVNRALADKICSLVRRMGVEEPCAICGGGALNAGLIKSVEEALELRLLVPLLPHAVTALGAAVIARSLESCDPGLGTDDQATR